MTVTDVDAPPTRMGAALASLSAAVEGLLAVPLSGLVDDEVPGLVVGVEQQVRRLAAVDHRLVGELSSRCLAGRFGRASVADLLVSLLQVSPGEARSRVQQAHDLSPRMTLQGERLPALLPATAGAVAEGAVSPGHVAVIAKAVDAVPAAAGLVAPQVVEATLLRAAGHEHPGQLARTAQMLLARLDPDGLEPAVEEIERRRELSLCVAADGSGRLRGRLGVEATAVWTTILDTLSAPVGASAARRTTDTDDRDPRDDGDERPVEPQGDPSMDQRSAAQRRHDGLVEAGRRLLRSGDLPPAGGVPVTVLVRTTATDVATCLPADTDAIPSTGTSTNSGIAVTDRGALWPTHDLLDGLSDAEIIPVHLDQHGAVLRLGHTRRLATRTQRLALHARDGGCTFPGCDRPAPWTEAHHVTTWQAGGPTDIDNLALLCRFHHRTIDTFGWTLQMDHGVPEWTPPPWIDPHQRPQRNTAHHPPDLDFGEASGSS